MKKCYLTNFWSWSNIPRRGGKLSFDNSHKMAQLPYFFYPKSSSTKIQNPARRKIMRNCTSIERMSKAEILKVIIETLKLVPYYFRGQKPPFLDEQADYWRSAKLGLLFQESSSRTLGSFGEAFTWLMGRLGIPMTAESSSLKKNETLLRSVITLIQQGCSAVCLRTKIEGAAEFLAQQLYQLDGSLGWFKTSVPILNGGDGTRNHPTQILLDMVTIVLRQIGVRRMNEEDLVNLDQFLKDKTDEELSAFISEVFNQLTIAFVGDLRFSRVVSSWLDIGRKFTVSYILVAPSIFQVEDWQLAGLNAAKSEKLADARQANITYVLRGQVERLKQFMPEAAAREVLSQLSVDERYLDGYSGELMHAQPLDSETPMIDPSIWHHPQCTMDMQAAMGPPTRAITFHLCSLGREEEVNLFTVPAVASATLLEEPIAVHQAKPAEKWAQTQRSINPLNRGTVIDHLLPGTGQVLDRLLQLAGIYGSDGSDGVVVPRKPSGEDRKRRKDIIFLDDRFVANEVLAALGLFAPDMRVIILDDGKYCKVKVDLPSAVASILKCPNADCVTRVAPEAKSFFTVDGSSPNGPHLNCGFCRGRFTKFQIFEQLR